MATPLPRSTGPSPGVRTYSNWFRGTLSIGALVTAILPAPVMIFQLLPAYGVQARFLIFYGPLVCFLTLAYLFYVRDALARAMFANLLDPPPEPDPYYGEPLLVSVRRVFRRARSIVLALLPIALVLTSSYCAVEYVRLVNRSAWEAVEQGRHQPTVNGERLESTESRRDSVTPKPGSRSSRRRRPSLLVGQDTVKVQPSPDSLRRYVLQTAGVDDIPSFTRLNILYIGIFLSAEIALILMALKEYAKEAMGLTERDLMLGLDPTPPT
jgi:hypothetical protein